MKQKIIAICILIFSVAVTFTILFSNEIRNVGQALSTYTVNKEAICWQDWDWKTHQLHNEYREAIGIHPLIWSEELTLAAKLKAAEMYDFENDEVGFWGHKNPQTDNISTWGFIRTAGYDYRYAGENLGQGFDDYHDMFVSWTNSPKHLENIESRDYTHIGIYILCDDKINLTVTVFGSLQL